MGNLKQTCVYRMQCVPHHHFPPKTRCHYPTRHFASTWRILAVFVPFSPATTTPNKCRNTVLNYNCIANENIDRFTQNSNANFWPTRNACYTSETNLFHSIWVHIIQLMGILPLLSPLRYRHRRFQTQRQLSSFSFSSLILFSCSWS